MFLLNVVWGWDLAVELPCRVTSLCTWQGAPYRTNLRGALCCCTRLLVLYNNSLVAQIVNRNSMIIVTITFDPSAQDTSSGRHAMDTDEFGCTVR